MMVLVVEDEMKTMSIKNNVMYEKSQLREHQIGNPVNDEIILERFST